MKINGHNLITYPKIRRLLKKLLFHSVRPECFLSSKNVSKGKVENYPYRYPSIHSPALRFVEHSGRTGWGLYTLRYLPLFFLSCVISACESPQSPEEQIKALAQKGYVLIDALFDNACTSIVAKEDLMSAQWLGKQNEIKEIQNLLSDAILLAFDYQEKNPIPELLSTHVQQKISEKIPTIFEIDKISVKRVQDFYEFSHTMCKLSGGSSCGRIMRAIESDHFDKILLLKAQKIAREQLRKEEAAQLRDALMLGKRKG
jgi:hypothetical protein